MTTDLILGTAGHIDHGKTSLVKALTGTDTDRLPEEKKRGITIELGFAELDLGDVRLGIVDVPGHERFVRNMLAGATGIDLALLVVAADDSVKPQTREHLEILRLLGVGRGVIALTKCDLPQPEWLELVTEEVRELVAGTFLAKAPLIRTSAYTGAGLDQLRTALAAAARDVAAARPAVVGPFRMAIDRTFTIAGHGTVVTGSVTSGQARLGDELAIEPGGIAVRVRGLQNHDRPVDEIHRGQRAAINLAGVHHDALGRGQELCTPGHLVPSRLLTARLSLLPSAPRPLKGRARVQLHLGTAELAASVVLLDRDPLPPGDEAFAQLFLSQPVVCSWSQAFIIRQSSPALTIGGGRVLDPNAVKVRRREGLRVERLATLCSDDPVTRAGGALYFAGVREWRPEDLARTAGIQDVAAATQGLAERGDLVSISLTPTRTARMHRGVLTELEGRIEETLGKLHAQSPLATTVQRSRLAHRLAYLGSEALVDAILQTMSKAGRIRLSQRGIALAGHGPRLSHNEQKLMATIIEMFRAAGLQPPSVADVKAQVVKNQAVVPQLVELAAGDGDLIKIAPDLYLHADVERHLKETLASHLTGTAGLTVSQIREILGVSRKYAVPYCEYLDRIGFTRRQGDVRLLAAQDPPAGVP
jgi:selenocysteine-specific elongation factor